MCGGLFVILLSAASVLAASALPALSGPIKPEDVIRLQDAGISERTLIEILNKYPESIYVDAAIRMKKAGLSEQIVLTTLATMASEAQAGSPGSNAPTETSRLRQAGFSEAIAAEVAAKDLSPPDIDTAIRLKRAGLSDQVILSTLATMTGGSGSPPATGVSRPGSAPPPSSLRQRPQTEVSVQDRQTNPAAVRYLLEGGYFRPSNTYASPLFTTSELSGIKLRSDKAAGFSAAAQIMLADESMVEIQAWTATIHFTASIEGASVDLQDRWQSLTLSYCYYDQGLYIGGGPDYLRWARNAQISSGTFNLGTDGDPNKGGLAWHILAGFNYIHQSRLVATAEVRYALIGKAIVAGGKESRSGWQLAVMLGYGWSRE
jgi:hypothetical protein